MKFKFENEKLICQDVESLRRMFAFRRVKVTGTTFLSLLGKSKNHSAAFALLKKMTGFKPDIDPKYAHAGYQYEPVLIEKLMETETDVVNYQPIEARAVQFDYFKENKYFGGIPDLIVFRNNENVEIVDIKTTNIKKLEFEKDPMKKHWAPFISPESAQKNSPDYVFQLFLYSYLAREHKNMNVTRCSLFAGFLNEIDYPDCSGDEVKYKPVNENMTTRYLVWPYTDSLHRKMHGYMIKATEVIENFLNTGVIEFKTIPETGNWSINENVKLLDHMKKQGFIEE